MGKRASIHSILLGVSLSVLGQPGIQPLSLKKDPQILFEHLSTRAGLSDQEVISVFQDKYGYLWFGTIYGLNKFNGYSVQVFRFDRDDTTSLSSDLVECMAEDPFGNLWIGTDRGLNRYDRKQNRFHRYVHRLGDSATLAGDHIRALYMAPDTMLWIETFDGTLHALDVRSYRIRRYPHQAPGQPDYHYHVIYEDSEGRLWIGGRDLGIIYFDRDSGLFHTIRADEKSPTGKRERDVSSYLEDSQGNFWVSGVDGVYLLDRERDEFRKVFATSTWSMLEDNHGMIWWGTGHGLYRYDPSTNSLTGFLPEPDNPYSISSLQIHQVYQDRQGTLWIATANGINRISRTKYPFRHIRHIPGNSSTLSSNHVTTLLQDHEGYLWIGTLGQGLNRYDPLSGEITRFKHDPLRPGSLGSDKISCLYEDTQGQLWIGLWAGVGFQRYDKKNNTFRSWRYNPGSRKEDWYSAFAEDSLGNFYLGFWGGPGLTLFDRTYGRFQASIKERFDPVNESRLTTVLHTDRKGHIWVGTSTVGIHRYDPASGGSVHWGYVAGDSASLLGPVINTILEDRHGMIWIGGTGLSRLDPETGVLVHYTEADGLANNTVMGIEQDQGGNLWISTRNGLSKFDPGRETFQNFTVEDGLQDNAFSRAHTKLATGELAFGGANGFTLFHPDSIVVRPDTSSPVLEQFRVFDHLRQADLCEVERIDLAYDENFFSFEFALPGHIQPEGISYVYRLRPLEQAWNKTGTKHRKATYTSVPPGSYLFEAGLSNPAGGQPTGLVTMALRIRPPFWNTWWFYLLEGMAALAVIFGLFRIREKQLRLRSRTLELKQKLLRLQMNPHFIFNSLFAIQNYIYEQQADLAGRYLSEFAHLIRLILNNSREEYISLEREIETIRLYLDLQLVRFNQSFTYRLDVDPEIDAELTAVPPMLAQPFIENALEHGLRHKEGEGHIWISFYLDGEMIRFEVADDGIGLARAGKLTKRPMREHTSLALEITRERIGLLNRRLSRKIVFEITDRQPTESELPGTLIRFSIPYMDFTPPEPDK